MKRVRFKLRLKVILTPPSRNVEILPGTPLLLSCAEHSIWVGRVGAVDHVADVVELGTSQRLVFWTIYYIKCRPG